MSTRITYGHTLMFSFRYVFNECKKLGHYSFASNYDKKRSCFVMCFFSADKDYPTFQLVVGLRDFGTVFSFYREKNGILDCLYQTKCSVDGDGCYTILPEHSAEFIKKFHKLMSE